jgi:hypothetical protein
MSSVGKFPQAKSPSWRLPDLDIFPGCAPQSWVTCCMGSCLQFGTYWTDDVVVCCGRCRVWIWSTWSRVVNHWPRAIWYRNLMILGYVSCVIVTLASSWCYFPWLLTECNHYLAMLIPGCIVVMCTLVYGWSRYCYNGTEKASSYRLFHCKMTWFILCFLLWNVPWFSLEEINSKVRSNIRMQESCVYFLHSQNVRVWIWGWDEIVQLCVGTISMPESNNYGKWILHTGVWYPFSATHDTYC